MSGSAAMTGSVDPCLESPNADHKFIKPGQQPMTPQQQQAHAAVSNMPLKMPKSPTIHRQMSFGKGNIINASLITNLQFAAANPQSKST